jgi:hypothetical protein
MIIPFIVLGQHSSNLVVISRHEPAKNVNSAPKSQQTLIVAPRTNGIHSENLINRVVFPSQLVNSFLPRAILSNSNNVKNTEPTALIPVATTSSGSGFNEIKQSLISDLVAKVSQHAMEIGQRANLLKKSVETNDMKTNALAGLIKATAEKRIKEILSSALGELTGIQKAGTKTTLDSAIKSHTVEKGNGEVTSQAISKTKSRWSGKPIVLQNRQRIGRQPTPKQSTGILSSTRQTSSVTGPLVLSRQHMTASRPLVLAPQRRVPTRQRNTEARARTRPVASTITRMRSPTILTPSRVRQPTTLSRSLAPRRRQSITRTSTIVQSPPLIPTPILTRQQTRTSTIRQRGTPSQMPTRAPQCPSQDDCKLVVPASCRRPSYITDANGRRLCRGCDEDRCAFAGFEQRWGRGFG